MSRFKLFTLLLCLCATTALGLAHGQCENKDDKPLATFDLKQGAETAVEGADFKLGFVNVTQDSRCPEGTTCIWAGNARLRLRVVSANGASKEFELNTT